MVRFSDVIKLTGFIKYTSYNLLTWLLMCDIPLGGQIISLNSYTFVQKQLIEENVH